MSDLQSDAEEIETELFDGKTFRCPKHGEFDVAIAVLNTLTFVNASLAEWETALKTASKNAIEGSRPRILTYDFHDLPPRS